MQLIYDNKGKMKIVESSDFSGDFDDRMVFNRAEKRKLARPATAREVRKLSGTDNLGFTLPGFLQTAVTNVQSAVTTGISNLATGAINYGVSALTPRDDAAAAAQTAAQQQALELERQKAVTAQQQAAAALAQAQAVAAQAATGAGNFMKEYKTPLMIGGGVLALLVGLKVARVI